MQNHSELSVLFLGNLPILFDEYIHDSYKQGSYLSVIIFVEGVIHRYSYYRVESS
jgi:hypothetical protein